MKHFGKLACSWWGLAMIVAPDALELLDPVPWAPTPPCKYTGMLNGSQEMCVHVSGQPFGPWARLAIALTTCVDRFTRGFQRPHRVIYHQTGKKT